MSDTRLQKLLRLLESNNSSNRKAAGRQICEVAKAHEQQLVFIIRKVQTCLYSKSWDARVAAAETLGLLAEAFPHHSVADLEQAVGPAGPHAAAGVAVQLDQLDLQQVLQKGAPLVASGGQEYDDDMDEDLTPAERLAKQRTQLKKRLGLDRSGLDKVFDTSEIIEDADITAAPTARRGSPAGTKGAAAAAEQLAGLNALQRSRLKRKQRPGATGTVPVVKAEAGSGGGAGKASNGAMGSSKAASGGPSEQQVMEGDQEEGAAIEGGGWPFQRLCDQLLLDILDPCWEVRHGATAALREVLRHQAAAAAVEGLPVDPAASWGASNSSSAGGRGQAPGRGLRQLQRELTVEELAVVTSANKEWLEECLVLLLCVLALDQYADYSADQVVVPVRETCAQALGAALQPLDITSLRQVLQLLSSCYQWGAAHRQWHVRHGGFTGIKYLLASRPDAAQALLPEAMPVLLQGLQDGEDSVQAAAADALVPMAGLLGEVVPESLQELAETLWDQLGAMEELSVATSSTLTLLAALYGRPGSCPAAASTTVSYSRCVPLLWPFLNYPLTVARQASLSCLRQLLVAAGGAAAPQQLPPGVLCDTLKLLFQQLLMESDAALQRMVLEAWVAVVDSMPPASLAAALSAQDVQNMFALAATPARRALDTRRLLVAEGQELVSMSEALDTGLVARPAKKQRTEGEGGGGGGGGDAGLSAYDPEQVFGGDSPLQVLVARRVAAQALGCLCHRLQQQEPPLMAPLLLQQLAVNSATVRLLAGLTLCDWVVRVRQDLAEAAGTPPAAQQPGPGAAGAAAAPAGGGAELWQQPSATEVAQQVLQCIPGELLQRCLECLAAPSAATPSPPSLDPYSELQAAYAQLHRQLVPLLSTCLSAGWHISTPHNLPLDKVGVEGALQMLATIPPQADMGEVAALKATVVATTGELQSKESYVHLQTCCCLAAALAHAGQLPAKLNLLIPNLMFTSRKDGTGELQQVAAVGLAELVLCCTSRDPGPNFKVIKNLVSCACGDPEDIPSAALTSLPEDAALAERRASHQAASSSGAPPLLHSTNSIGSGDLALGMSQTLAAAARSSGDGEDTTPATARRGAELALAAICRRFGPRLRQLLPSLWEAMAGAVGEAAAALPVPGTAAPSGVAVKVEDGGADAVKQEPAAAGAAGAGPDAQSIIHALQMIKVVLPHLHPQLQPEGFQLLPSVVACLQHTNAGVRLAAARCLGVVGAAAPEATMPLLLRHLLPLLEGTQPAATRLGATEAAAQLERHLGPSLVPYVVLLLVPLLRRMSDPVVEVRQRVAACFGALTSLLPLAQAQPLPPGLEPAQAAQALGDQAFLEQLLDNRKLQPCELPMQLNVTPRHYQQEGISWLAFLHKFGLHGCLADDMGLGKTLQATAILACSLSQQRDAAASAAAAAAAAAAAGAPPVRPSLVVCPSTLVDHWAHEISKYVSPEALRPLVIQGTPADRAAAQKQLPHHDVAIISYESLRSDAAWAASQQWDYVILDEGHVIRNPKSKLAAAVKRLGAQHRLVLSGTPIQNSALELWGLFDFLMPGLLGDERSFQARYGRTVAAARFSRKGSKESDASLLVLDQLHKQVMPFVLRRTKQQVLSDLPPKIITDIVCELSPLQRLLYEDFAASAALSEVAGALAASAAAAAAAAGGAGEKGGAPAEKGSGHIFTALLYLRRLCTHPLLALDWKVPAHVAAVKRVLHVDSAALAEPLLRGLDQGPKLLALRDIFVQCGLLGDSVGSGSSSTGAGALPPRSAAVAAVKQEGGDVLAEAGGSDGGHRLLVFAQLKGTLDLVEGQLLQPLGLSYLRLDGSVAPAGRFALVQQFNSDPTIQVLLLTTHVGGLGLNLTSADTVVFLEHDWNPMKDLQAMDRAHRLGQTRCVNVYRLLMKDTLEERIMGLQQFKLDVANAVVNQDNVSMSSMDTGALLDLFGAPGGSNEGGDAGAKAKKRSALAQMLDGMGELWDSNQYEAEFDMREFLGKLTK